ncbi:MAG: AAA family ATPase [Pirellulaceae bacterium]|nr:AAA family ATPase [Pirellulaceae bacterium]
MVSSRWSVFRRLCQYYAECVRLDQGTTLHGKADQENWKFVCLAGNLAWPESDEPPQMMLQIPSGWSEFIKHAKQGTHLYLGAPLNRYRWKDSSTGQETVFVSPVFLAPVAFEIDRTSLHLRALGQVRINDGWLERRLKNSEDRRVFLELCGFDIEESDFASSEPHYRSFAPFCDLLSHYYAKWCADVLDIRRLRSSPSMSHLQNDGIYNRAALFVPGKWRYTARLHDELLKLAWQVTDDELDHSALAHVFPHAACKPSVLNLHPRGASRVERLQHGEAPAMPEDAADDLSCQLESLVHLAMVEALNDEQLKACQSSASELLSVIVGPPGTGKSRVVSAVLAQAAIAGRSALFASRNHQALEAVVPRLNATVEPSQIILRLARPFGQQVDASLPQALTDILSKPVHERALVLRDQLRGRCAQIVARLAEIQQQVRETQELHASLAEAEYAVSDARVTLPTDMIDQLALVQDAACSMEIGGLLKTLGPLPPAAFSWKWFVGFFRRLMALRACVRRARQIDDAFTAQFGTDTATSVSLPNADTKQPDLLRFRLRHWLRVAQAIEAVRKVAELRERIGRSESLDVVYARYAGVLAIDVAASRECLRGVADAWGAELTPEERQELVDLWAGIQNYQALGGDLAERNLDRLLQRSFPILLNHVPLLATTNLSAGRHLPWKAGSIDLLIIDESSQCDIASVVPLLFRCRRAMFVGDPMQLSHVTRISGALDTQLRRQFKLLEPKLERYSYRTTSAFHLAAAAEHLSRPIQLRQHHRCHPRIAEYCNSAFYRETLVVMTNAGGLGTGQSGLRWTDVPADAEGIAGGGAISRRQIDAVLAELVRLRDKHFAGTVGVVTPFRQQANRIRDAVWEHFDQSLLDNWRMLVDTADGFQGDERHVVLFSLVGGPDMPAGSARFLAQTPNRFNVAVSRAMHLLHVFGDLEWAKNCPAEHIRRLAKSCKDEPGAASPLREDLIGPVWEPRLAEALVQAGIPFTQQYPACGKFLDFALLKPGLKLNVEVDGETYHKNWDGSRKREDLERDLLLVANGWTVQRFWVYQLREDLAGCVERIRRRWNVT